MSRRIAALLLAGFTIGVGSAHAQDSTSPGPGAVEVTYTPVSAAFFASEGNLPSFGNYGFGTAASFRINRVLAIEGDIGAMIATTSDLQFGDLDSHTKAPNFLSYTANVVVTPWTGRALVPYATGGIGGLTMFERLQLGATGDETFLTGNVGGGLKWYAPNNRWGLRADYRFGVTQAKDDAPAFFGRDTRYVHRAYAGVIVNTRR